MKTVQLVCRIGLFTALTAGFGCNRQATEADARKAAQDVKVAAARASEQLADSWLTTKIQGQYFADNDIKARYINVSTQDGVVTLRGRVDNENAHQQAVQIARNTDGVKDVRDQLAIGATARGDVPDQLDAAWITTKIQAKYFADPTITGHDITVTTTNGIVTLTGRVESDTEKQQALSIARNTEGVRSVEDRLVVQPPASNPVATTGSATPSTTGSEPVDDGRITASIQSKYFVDEMVKGRRIDVDTHQGVVTLRGEVGSESERAQALRLARTTDGVQRVEDSLTVIAAASASATAPSPGPSTGVGTSTTPADRRSGSGVTPQVDDALLTTKIQSKFFVDNEVRAGSIGVTSKNGVVTLEGMAPSPAAKQRAITIARDTEGVAQVIDRITVAKTTAKAAPKKR